MNESLYVCEVGTGTPLVLIHGLLVSGEMFQGILDQFATRHRVIIPDLRGHGRSEDLSGPYDVPQHARDLNGVLERLQIESAAVLGYSQGGAVAQQFVRDYPTRVSGLVLACTYSCNLLTRRERLEARLLPWILRLIGPKGLAKLISLAGGGGPRLPPEQRREFARMIAANDRARALASIGAMTSFDSRPWLSQIAGPTLIIAGANDTAVPAHHAQMLANGIPGAQLQEVAGAGHTLLWTHPAELVRRTEEFLSSAG